MGRRARPVELLVLTGKKHLTKKEIQERREAEARVRPPADAVRCPQWLDAEGRKEWRRITGALQAIGLITNVDVSALAIYCSQVSDYVTLSRRIRQEAFVDAVQEDGSVARVPNPELPEWREERRRIARIIRGYLVEFGLSPSARAKLTLPKRDDKPKDQFEELFGS